MKRVTVQQLTDHPFVRGNDIVACGQVYKPGDPPTSSSELRANVPGRTMWMVTVQPSWWRRLLFGQETETFVVEVDPTAYQDEKAFLWPSYRKAPWWVLEAIERNQDGSATIDRPPAELAAGAAPLQIVEGGKP